MKVIINIAGLLGAPSELSGSYDDENKELYVKWTPPFVLDGIGVEYIVCVNYDIPIGNNDDQCIQEFTINRTEWTFPNVSSNGTGFRVCVSALTKAGKGNQSCGKSLIAKLISVEFIKICTSSALLLFAGKIIFHGVLHDIHE